MKTESAVRCVGDLEVDVRRRRVLVAGRDADLTTREFDILETLATHPEWVFTPDQLSGQDAWSPHSPFAVNVHISRLRAKLAKAGSTASILAVRGAGYRLRVLSDVSGAGRDEASFVGRESEIRLLLTEMGRAHSSRARVVFITGEAGIGKSRIAQELCQRAEAMGAAAFWGRSQIGKMPPYRPWSEVLSDAAGFRNAGPEIGRVFSDHAGALARLIPGQAQGPVQVIRIPPKEGRFMLFDGVTEVLTAVSRVRPLVVVLDDLHWAPEPSLALLDFFVRHAADARILVLALFRPEQARLLPLGTTLGGLMSHQQCSCVSLEGLPSSDVARLVAEGVGEVPAAGIIESVQAWTGGNPFFVIELTRMMTAATRTSPFDVDRLGDLMPTPNVLAVVRSRVDGLSPKCRELIEVGAVAGAVFSVELVARVARMKATHALGILEEAVSAGFLVELNSPRTLRFSHALVQQVVYRDIPMDRRTGLHGRVGDAMRASSAGSESSVAAIADHYYQATPAGYGRDAIEYTLLAARQAMAHSAFESAVTGLRGGLDLLETTTLKAEERRDLHVALREALGDALAAAAELEQTEEAYEIALRDCLPSQRVRRAALHGKLAVVAMQKRQLPLSLGLTELAQECLGEDPGDQPSDEWWQVWCESEPMRLQIYYYLGMSEEFDERAAEYCDRFEEHASADLRSVYTNWLVLRSLWRERYIPSEETVRLARRHYQDAQRAGLGARLHAAQLAGTTLGWAGQWDEAEARLAEAIELCEKIGDAGTKLMGLANLSTIPRLRNDPATTRERAQGCLEWGRHIGAAGDLTAAPLANLSWVALREGDLAEAKRGGTEASDLMRRHNPRFPGRWLGGWPVVAASLGTGDLAVALEFANDLLDPTQMALQRDVQTAVESALSASRAGDSLKAADALRWAVELVRPLGYT